MKKYKRPISVSRDPILKRSTTSKPLHNHNTAAVLPSQQIWSPEYQSCLYPVTLAPWTGDFGLASARSPAKLAKLRVTLPTPRRPNLLSSLNHFWLGIEKIIFNIRIHVIRGASKCIPLLRNYRIFTNRGRVVEPHIIGLYTVRIVSPRHR